MDHICLSIFLICTGIKALLIPSYRSTDFEVHRNWLAITHSKPFLEWYTDGASSSEWTLDYPPFFAWFEWMLAKVAYYFDPNMLDVDNLNYASDNTILFQRLSVIITELLLLFATYISTKSMSIHRRRLAFFLIAANPALIIVDHIHFQYNGMLLGIFILSIWCTCSNRELLGAALFSILLCMKHIFLYAAPPFFIFLFQFYCRNGTAYRPVYSSSFLLRFFTLGFLVLSIFGVSFAPYFIAGQGGQILGRLFPVSRGLLHAYWAPNFWAIYASIDKITHYILCSSHTAALFSFLPQYLQNSNSSNNRYLSRCSTATLTGGLVGEAPFAILPQIGSLIAMMCTLGSMLPCMIYLWRYPYQVNFFRSVLYCTLCSFVFGYHVHEKAILMVLLPLAILASGGDDRNSIREYSFLMPVATYSLFPLLIRKEEYGVKVLLLLTYLFIATPWIKDEKYWSSIAIFDNTENDTRGIAAKQSRKSTKKTIFLNKGEQIYLLGLILLELYALIGHSLVFSTNKLPFLPLLLTSLYCSLGVVYGWMKMAWYYYCMIDLRTTNKRDV